MDELSAKELDELRELFAAHDRNGDGRLTLEELRASFESGEEPTEAELRGLLVKADANGDDSIDFPEFLAFMQRRMSYFGVGDEVREEFDAFDTDRDGFVSIEELHQVMQKVGEQMSREEAESALRRADRDGDGRLSYPEFVAFMLGPR